jgi:hypothetical protein
MENPKKPKRKIRKKKVQTARDFRGSLDSSHKSNLYASGNSHRGSDKFLYSSKRSTEFLESGKDKDINGYWEMWWKQKEENEGKLKDLITKRDYEGTPGNFILNFRS